jgi:hypothetical protein
MTTPRPKPTRRTQPSAPPRPKRSPSDQDATSPHPGAARPRPGGAPRSGPEGFNPGFKRR